MQLNFGPASRSRAIFSKHEIGLFPLKVEHLLEGKMNSKSALV